MDANKETVTAILQAIPLSRLNLDRDKTAKHPNWIGRRMAPLKMILKVYAKIKFQAGRAGRLRKALFQV